MLSLIHIGLCCNWLGVPSRALTEIAGARLVEIDGALIHEFLDRILVLLHKLPPEVVFGYQPSTHSISSRGDASYLFYGFLGLLPHQIPLLVG